jgi:energy-coupling factor transporter ATP-binding protein EcfA2
MHLKFYQTGVVMMKNMQLSKIFFLAFLIQSFIPARASSPELKDILELREGLATASQKIQEALNEYPNARSIIIGGTTGSGKSTLVNLLAGRQCIAQEADLGFNVHTDDPLPGFAVQHGYVVGTTIPNAWHSPRDNNLFWECPFDDPRGPVAEIINAYCIHKVFKQPNTKILLVVEEDKLRLNRTKGFLELLKRVATFFPEEKNPQLGRCLTLIISKQERCRNIAGYLQNDVLPLPIEHQNLLTPPVRNLLRELVADPGQIAFFPYPKEVGAYVPNMWPVRDAINATEYMNNPAPVVSLSAEATLILEKLVNLANTPIWAMEDTLSVLGEEFFSLIPENQIQLIVEALAIRRIEVVEYLEKFLPRALGMMIINDYVHMRLTP